MPTLEKAPELIASTPHPLGFDLPVVVYPHIPLDNILKDLGLYERIPASRFSEESLSEKPYIFWVGRGRRHLLKSADEVREILDPNEALVNLRELAHVYWYYPELFRTTALIATASSYGMYHPHISTFSRPPELFVVRRESGLRGYIVLTRSREIQILESERIRKAI